MQHDLKTLEFPRQFDNEIKQQMVHEAEIHYWCICGDWFGIVEHRFMRRVSNDFQNHLHDEEVNRVNNAHFSH